MRTAQILMVFFVASLTAACGGGDSSGRTQQGGTAPKSTSSTGTGSSTTTDSSTATDTATETTVPTGDDQIATVTAGGLSFSIFKYEATVVDGKARSLKDSDPTVSINWADAKAACVAAGYDLCKVAMWQAACKGVDNLLFGYAATKDGPPKVEDACDVARTTNNTPGSLPSKTGSHAQCVTKGLDIYDMVGNASEWGYDGNEQPKALGVAFYQEAGISNCDGALNAGATEQTTDVGFRCCK